ncbi:MAG: MFS transporter [Acidimicrobiales bacterium]
MDDPEHTPDRASDPRPQPTVEQDVEDPSGLVAKLRALWRRNGSGGVDGGTGEGDRDGHGHGADRLSGADGADDAGVDGDHAGDDEGFRRRVFGSATFFRLWLAQAVTSMGDWLNVLATVTLASEVGAGAAGASVGIVMAARIIPGLFFAAPAGVLIDRMDRKQVMVVTNVVRAGVVALLPFVNSVLGLVFAVFVLELASLLFAPAKEAAVPNLVPADRLTSASSLGLAAAYGSFPVAAILFALLAEVSEWLGSISVLDALKTSQEAVAFGVAVGCYLIAALIIGRLSIPKDHIRRHDDEPAIDLGAVFTDIKEGWHYAFLNPVVRAVNIGLATGLIGGGMLIPLGDLFSKEVLGAGTSGFGVFVAALGLGVGAGIIGVSTRQATIQKDRAFVISVFSAGVALILGASMWTLPLAALSVALMGIFAGSVYVLGFALVHENIDDEVRGRVFAGLLTLAKLCVLFSMAIGPLLADLLDRISDKLFERQLSIVGVEIAVPGVRLALWLAGVLVLLASVLAARSLRAPRREVPRREPAAATSPADGGVAAGPAGSAPGGSSGVAPTGERRSRA